MNYSRLSIFLSANLLLALSGFSQSNTCANAPSLGNDETLVVSFDGSSFTTSGFDGAGSCAPSASTLTTDLFWRYTAPRTGNYRIVLVSPGRPMQVSAHLGSDCQATCIGTASDAAGRAKLDVLLTVGDEILIQGGGAGAAFDTGGLFVTFQSDSCSDASVLGSDTSYELKLNTALATTSGFDGGGVCGFSTGLLNQDLFYVYTAPFSSGYYSFMANGSPGFQPQIRLYDGQDCSASCLNFATNANFPGFAEISLMAGDQLLIQIGGLGIAAGECDLTIIGGLSDGCGLLIPDALETPLGNNTCATAVEVTPGQYPNLNVGAFDPDYYRIDLAAGQTLAIRETGAGTSTQWTLYDSTCAMVLDSGDSSLDYLASAGPETVIVEVRLEFQLSCDEYGFEVETPIVIGANFCDPAGVHCGGSATGLVGSVVDGLGRGSLLLSATSGPSGALGYFLASAAFATPGLAISNGTLCLGGGSHQIYRYNVAGGNLNSMGAFNSDGSIFINLAGTGHPQTGVGFLVPTELPTLSAATIAAGSTWHFQLWFRDDCLAAGNSNFSEGLSVTF